MACETPAAIARTLPDPDTAITWNTLIIPVTVPRRPTNGHKATNVWKMAAKTGDSQIRAEAMAMIDRCPSGALSYTVDGETIEPDLPTEVAVIPDGPLWVSGGIEVTRSDGSVLETRNRVTLCRCGQSGSKPLCDGSHKAAGFTG